MREITDLASVKQQAIAFLYLEPKPIKGIDFLVEYPFLETSIGCTPLTHKIFNVFLDKQVFETYKEEMREIISTMENLNWIFDLFRRSYQLTFFKYVNKYLSVRDFSQVLSGVWTLSEFPSRDVNVSKEEFAYWFEVADKTILMDEYELEKYNALPDTFQVYRGVASDTYRKGLSWTLSYETAEFFATRFEFNDTPVIYSFTISKKDVLAYFGDRNEAEIIINPLTLENYKINTEYL